MSVEDRLQTLGKLYESRHELKVSHSARQLFHPRLNMKSMELANALKSIN